MTLQAELSKRVVLKFTPHLVFHLDDSIETLVFHLARGTRLGGITGIPEQNGYILRPLLAMTKQDILTTLEGVGLDYRTDASNADIRYARNRIRANVLPELEHINPEYRSNIRSFMMYASELQFFIGASVEVFLQGKDYFDIAAFQQSSLFLQREIIRVLYVRANAGAIGLSEGNIAEVIRFIGDKGNKTRKEIHALKLLKYNGSIYTQEIYPNESVRPSPVDEVAP